MEVYHLYYSQGTTRISNTITFPTYNKIKHILLYIIYTSSLKHYNFVRTSEAKF